MNRRQRRSSSISKYVLHKYFVEGGNWAEQGITARLMCFLFTYMTRAMNMIPKIYPCLLQ